MFLYIFPPEFTAKLSERDLQALFISFFVMCVIFFFFIFLDSFYERPAAVCPASLTGIQSS